MSTKRHRLTTGSPLTQIRGLLRRHGLRARKGLGQHFLIDETVLRLITEAAELTPDDVVMEIGPGLGVLTRELAEQAGQVFAIELDAKLATILSETLNSFNNVVIIKKDVLKTEPAALLKDHFPPEISGSFGYKVVANLPYYITSPVLRHFLEASAKPQTMVLMMQKEVAEEIAAKPGRMSLLSVSVQLYGQPTIINHVPAHCFYPAPEVDSAILRIDTYRQPAVSVKDQKSFFTLVRAGFSASRKQIVNSLAQGLRVSKTEAQSLLDKANIVPQRRAETLTLDEWTHLWRVFTQMEKSAC